jgi:pimeloyl-ACP methyl ester carboxylesterase
VSPEQPRILAKYLPLAETHVIPGAGHMLWFTAKSTVVVDEDVTT